jgi:hypothetical protein
VYSSVQRSSAETRFCRVAEIQRDTIVGKSYCVLRGNLSIDVYCLSYLRLNDVRIRCWKYLRRRRHLYLTRKLLLRF